MKKSLSLALVLVMVLSILAPAIANASRTSEAKAEELFNKSVGYFEPLKALDESEVKAFVTKEVFSKLVYDFFVQEINKHDELAAKLGDGTQLKANIDQLITDENISILLSELKTGEAVESLAILGEFITSVEELFEEDWDVVIDDGFKTEAKNIIANISGAIEETVDTKISDIENHWAKDEIQAMIALGIVNGYPDGTFQPNGKITRAEFAKTVATALELENEVYTGGFSDVVAGQWHADHIATLVENELVAGYPDGTFNPNGVITRNEIATILSKVLKLEISQEEQATLLSNFKDMALIPNWAKAAVAQVAKAELMKGDTDNNFNPANNATRAEAVTVIYRLINK